MTTLHRFALVLHTHVPYVRRNGVWPAGEDLFHQAATESYLPLIGVFERLAERGLSGVCTVGVTPVAAHQMTDPHMRRELDSYLARYELRAMRQVANYRDRHADQVKDLAAFYARFGREQSSRLTARPGGIAATLSSLANTGTIELLGGPATHPLLTAIQSERIRALQIETGLAAHEASFGARPAGMWIPECAVAPGIAESITARGVSYAVCDPVSVPDGVPSRAANLLMFPRSIELTEPVWSPGAGYPAGPFYRDFHHYDVVAGFKNWRVTDPAFGIDRKEPYDPEAAVTAARADAADYVRRIEAEFARTGAATLVAAFDTELFGHWWFEGPAWLESVLELLAAHDTIRPVTLAEAAGEAGPAAPDVELKPGTWGVASDERSWRSDATADIFERLGAAERRAEDHLDARGPLRDQMLRELFLAQSSDWPYMIVRDENSAYGRERFESHMTRMTPLLDALDGGPPADPAAVFEIDNCFAALPSPAAP